MSEIRNFINLKDYELSSSLRILGKVCVCMYVERLMTLSQDHKHSREDQVSTTGAVELV